MSGDRRYRFLPSEEQELLVHAAVERNPEAALRAWLEWKQRIDLAAIDTGSARLLPLAYVNLQGNAPDDETLALARGTYKKAWYRNLLLFREGTRAIDKLRGMGIPALVFKGAAIATRYYQNPGVRPMDDLDIAVPREDALIALRVLHADGWMTKDLPHQRGAPEELLPHCHGFDLEKGPEQFLDLHWNLIALHRTPEADDRFWQGADVVDFCGSPVLMPNITDSLLITCFHGCRQMFSGEVSTLRWCVDALEQLRVGGIDWERFKASAEFHGIGESVSIALAYLRDTLGADVPESVLATLRSVKTPFSHRHYLRCVMDYADTKQMEQALMTASTATDSTATGSTATGSTTSGQSATRRLVDCYKTTARSTYSYLFLRYVEEVAAAIPSGASPKSVLQHIARFPAWWRSMARRQKMTPLRFSFRIAKRLIASPLKRWRSEDRESVAERGAPECTRTLDMPSS